MLQQFYTERINALTISVSIQGNTHILGKKFELQLMDDIFELSETHPFGKMLSKEKYDYTFTTDIEPNKEWNYVALKHLVHPDDMAIMDGEKIVDFSYITVEEILIDDFKVPLDLWKKSGGQVYNPWTKKPMHLNKLAEPFTLEVNFYYPLEQWTFAVAEGNNNSGRIGWR